MATVPCINHWMSISRNNSHQLLLNYFYYPTQPTQNQELYFHQFNLLKHKKVVLNSTKPPESSHPNLDYLDYRIFKIVRHPKIIVKYIIYMKSLTLSMTELLKMKGDKNTKNTSYEKANDSSIVATFKFGILTIVRKTTQTATPIISCSTNDHSSNLER